MFQINIYLRFALIALFLIGGIVPAFINGLSFWWGFPFILVGLILLAGYFLLGTINSTALLLQQGKIDEAEKRLALTFWPQLLYVANRSYYYMIKGNIALSKKDTEAGEMWLRKAQEVKLPSDNEKAMVLLQMCNIQMMKNNWPGAQNYFMQVKKLHISEKLIKEQIDQVEKAINSRGNINVARSMGKQGMQMMRMGGGKRRRPPMR